jgi:hypothetical protein
MWKSASFPQVGDPAARPARPEGKAMRLTYRVMLTLFSLAVVTVTASAQDKLEVFAGYSYLRPSMTSERSFTCEVILGCPPPPPAFVTTHPNFNGYEFSATYKLHDWLGVTGDFSGHYGPVTGNSSGHVQTFLFGPRISLPGKVSPFAHVLVGGAHESIGAGVTPITGFSASVIPTSGNAFATAIGGGIDLRVARFLSVRPIQLDYLMTRFNSTTQNQPRVSAGIVLRF